MADFYAFNSEEDIKRIKAAIHWIEQQIRNLQPARTARPVVFTRDLETGTLSEELEFGGTAEVETSFGDTLEIEDHILEDGKKLVEGTRVYFGLIKSEGKYHLIQFHGCPVEIEEEEE